MVKKKNSTKKRIHRKPKLKTRFLHIAHNLKYQKYYLVFSVFTLLFTTIIWSLLSARVHDANADQLVNPYMFESASTFRNALFPSQHTYLLKWPLFFAIHIFGNSTAIYHFFTVLICLTTVILFAYILYRIEKRPIVIGTVFLALASVLLLIPAQPYPGGLLPVNMGMISNRNIEYMLYVCALYGLIRAHKIKKPLFIFSASILALLIASDRLFLFISLGASLLACISYAGIKKWQFVSSSFRWFMLTIFGTLMATIVTIFITSLKLTHIPSQTSASYGLINSFHSLGLALLYAVTGTLTNFGANPAASTTYLSHIPSLALHNIFSLSGIAYITNVFVLIFSLSTALGVLLHSFGRQKTAHDQTNRSYQLSLLLIWSTIIAYASFLFTNHYYAGDARYISIILFTCFISLVTFTRTREWRPELLGSLGMIIALGIMLAIPSVVSYSHTEKNAGNDITVRNILISQAINSHPVNILVGDYWRVMPIRQMSARTTAVLPLGSCLEPYGVLSSLAWQPNLQDTSFAYILSLDKSRTNYPQCTENQILTAYGKPNASVVIAGTLDKPTEMLLFYDHGIHKNASINNVISNNSSTTHPIKLIDSPNTACDTKTVVNIVAHEDDDILFMNPDIQNEIKAASCVRTIYITAGDAGANPFYWLSREQGSEAAYSEMLGIDSAWLQRTIEIADSTYITVANPKGNSKISLIFLRLPDGNMRGQGFRNSHRESLHKLFEGQIVSVNSIDGSSAYTRDNLITSLESLLIVYKPYIINTQDEISSQSEFQDHSDHIAVANFANAAYSQYLQKLTKEPPTIRHYMGYPVRANPENLSDQEYEEKLAAFLRYADHDGAVCHSREECESTASYGSFLKRQYAVD